MEKLLTVEELGAIVGWKKKTIQNKIAAGKMPIPFIKLGSGKGDIRFRPSVVEKYLEKRTVIQTGN